MSEKEVSSSVKNLFSKINTTATNCNKTYRNETSFLVDSDWKWVWSQCATSLVVAWRRGIPRVATDTAHTLVVYVLHLDK